MKFRSIYCLLEYIKSHKLESANLIDTHLVLNEKFFSYRKYIWNSIDFNYRPVDIFFIILKEYDYSARLMKEKVFSYINRIEKKDYNDKFEYIIFNPFKEYIINNELQLNKPKINKIRKLFENIFFFKDLFLDKIPQECAKIIFGMITNIFEISL